MVGVGAHVGLFIEPHRVTCTLLTLNLRQNAIDNVTGGPERPLELADIADLMNGAHSAANSVTAMRSDGEQVEVTLEEVLHGSGPIDLKPDVEGVEFSASSRMRERPPWPRSTQSSARFISKGRRIA